MEAVKRVMGESDTLSSDGVQDPKQDETKEPNNSPEFKKMRTETPEELTGLLKDEETTNCTEQEDCVGDDEAEKHKDVAMEETTQEQKTQSSVDEGENQKASSQSETFEAEMPLMQPEDLPSTTDSVKTESLKIQEEKDEGGKEVHEIQSTSAEVLPTANEVDDNEINKSSSENQAESSSSAKQICVFVVKEAPAANSPVDAEGSSSNSPVSAKASSSSSSSSSHLDTEASPPNAPVDKWKAQSDAVINFLLDNRNDIDKVRNFHFVGKAKTPPSDAESVAKKPRKLKKIKQPSQSLTVSNDKPLERHQHQMQQPIRRGFKLVVGSKAKGKKKKSTEVSKITAKEVTPGNGQNNSSIASVAVPLSHYANQQQHELSPSSQNRIEAMSSGKSSSPGSISLAKALQNGEHDLLSDGKAERRASSLVISIDSRSRESTDEGEEEDDEVESVELIRRDSCSQSEVFVDEEIEMQQIPNVIVDSEVSMPELARTSRTPKKMISQQQQQQQQQQPQKRAEYSPSGRKLPPPPIILRDIKDQQRMPPYPNVSFSPPRDHPKLTASLQIPPHQHVQTNPFNTTSAPTQHAFSRHVFAPRAAAPNPAYFQQQMYPAYGQPRMMTTMGMAPQSSTQPAPMIYPYYNMMRHPMMGSQANSLSQPQFMNVRPSRPSYPQYLPNNYYP